MPREGNPVTNTTRGVRLINKLILDYKGDGRRFARDCLHHSMEIREWLAVKPELDFSKSKQPRDAQRRMQSILDSEHSINYRQNHFIYFAGDKVTAKSEFDVCVRDLVVIFQHLRSGDYAHKLLAYINDVTLLDAVRAVFKGVADGHLAPEVEAVVREVCEQPGKLISGPERIQTWTTIDELPWQKQREPQPAQRRGVRSGHLAAMMSMGIGAMSVGHK